MPDVKVTERDREWARTFVSAYRVRDIFGATAAPILELEEALAMRHAEGYAAGLEAAAHLVANWALSVEHCQDAARWHKAGGSGNALAGAAGAMSAAIRALARPGAEL